MSVADVAYWPIASFRLCLTTSSHLMRRGHLWAALPRLAELGRIGDWLRGRGPSRTGSATPMLVKEKWMRSRLSFWVLQ